MDELTIACSRLAWTQLWQLTLLIASVWLVLRLVGRNRPHLSCVLWLVVLVKCLTPPVVSSPSGIFCWLQRAQRPSAEVGQHSVAPVTIAGSHAAGPHGDALLVRAQPLPMIDPRQHEVPPAAIAASGVVSESGAATWRSLWPRLLWTAAMVWLAGTLVVSLAAAARFLACWRKLRAARQADDPALVQLVESLRSRLKLRRKVRLLVTDSPLGPAVVGLWRPAVILPAALVRGKTPEELEPLVAHELIHIRRGDLWVGLVQTLALGLWWFHPLVRLASRQVTREAERCCDEETIAHLGCDPAAYARSLLDVLALKQQLSPIPAFPGVRPVDVTSQRLERIMQLGQGCHKRTPWWCWLVMLAAAAAVLPGAALVVGANEKGEATRAAPATPWPSEPRVLATGEQGSEALAIEVRIISGGTKLQQSDHWRFASLNLSGLEPRPTAAKDDGNRGRFGGAAVTTVEKHVPAQWATMDDFVADELLKAAQSDREANVLQAPKVTVFNGQSVCIEDSTKRPFVVGAHYAAGKDPQPAIRVFAEGTSIRLRPELGKDDALKLNFNLELSAIGEVETTEYPGGLGNQPIEIQIPEIATTLLEATVDMKLDQTLFMRLPQTGKKGKKKQPGLCVMVKVTKVRSPMDATIPSQPQIESKPQDQARTVRQAMKQFVFESSGWRLRFASKEGGKLEVEQTDAREPLAKISIRGGVRLDASAEGHGKEKSDRIQAEADEVQVSTRPAKAEAPARLEIALDGNVRLMHGESRIEAGRVVLQIDEQMGKPAGIRVQITDGRSIEFPSKYYRPEDVQYFPPGPQGADAAWIEKVYPVADLVIPLPSGPIKVSASGGMVKQEPPATAKADFDSLVELITTTIRHDSWDRVGGRGEVSVATNSYSLVIRQQDQIHKQIADLLHQLRRLQDVQVVLTLHRLQVSAAELKTAAVEPESPLRPLVENPKSRVWCLKSDSIAKLKGLPGAKLHSGPKVTTFNGQSVDLRLADGTQQQDDLLTGLSIQPLVTADFRSLRLQVFGDTSRPAEAADAVADAARTSLDRALRKAPRPHQLPMELRELVLGQVLAVDETTYAWQEHERGVPVLDKVPHTARLFKSAAPNKPDTRHFYLITPSVLVASEEEDRFLSPRKE